MSPLPCLLCPPSLTASYFISFRPLTKCHIPRKALSDNPIYNPLELLYIFPT